MKPVLTAEARQAARDRAIEEAHFNSMIREARQKLTDAGWSDVDVKRKANFIAISGVDPAGAQHSGADEDGVSLADHLIAVGVAPPARKVTDEQLEAARADNPELFSEPPAEEGEALPDTLARLVPETIEEAKRKKWLRDRWLELGHKVHAPNVFGVTQAEIREHEELERYRGLFT